MTVSSSRYAEHIRDEDLILLVSELLSRPTVNPPGDEYLVKPILEQWMAKKLGAEVTVYAKDPERKRTNVIGKIGSGPLHLAFVNHMDVVPPGDGWDTDPFDPVVRNGKIFGRGALDDKGSFAASWAGVFAFLREHPDFLKKGMGNISLVATADEERGSVWGIRYLLDLGWRVDAAIVVDGGNLYRVEHGSCGIVQLLIKSVGVQAHGAYPERGENAIIPLAAFLAAWSREFDLGHAFDPDFERWTQNIGMIHGGVAPNVVPPYAYALIDIRIPMGLCEKDVLCNAVMIASLVMREYPWAKLSIEIESSRPPHKTPKDSLIAQALLRAASKLNHPIETGTSTGISEDKYLSEVGIPAVVHYPADPECSECIHKPNEYVTIEGLRTAAILYAETLREYFGLPACADPSNGKAGTSSSSR